MSAALSLIIERTIQAKYEVRKGYVMPVDSEENFQDIAKNRANQQEATSIRRQIDNILGRPVPKSSAVTPDQDKQIWHQHLEEKYGL